MFTPHRNVWTSPRRSAASGGAKWKGKAVAADEAPPPPPPTALLAGGGEGPGGGGNADDWRSFREAGFLDEANLQRREREAHLAKISELEDELHKYQYSMGILLIEKKEWCSKYEEMRQGLATAEEILKREQAAHLIAVSEFEKREGNIKKALSIEKQCVADLEKALREMRAETAEDKFTTEKNLTDAHALEASNEEKSVEIEGKLRSADAKLAEATRKSIEINIKLEEVQGRERELQRELSSLNNKRKVQEKDLAEQREYLQDWEKKLQEDQKRLADGQKLLNGRETRTNETEKVLKKKEKALEEERRAIEVIQNTLKDKEDGISIRQKALISKEKDAEIMMENIAKKEKYLDTLEEELTIKERTGLQKLLDDHSSILNAKKQEFETEMEHKRELFAEEVKGKLDAVEKENMAIKQKEEQIVTREQAVESKIQKLKIKEKDLETKSKALKKWEDSIKDDEKKLKEGMKQLADSKQEFGASKAKLERLKAEVEAGNQLVLKEKEKLELTKKEREQHLVLQSKLKQEIDEYMKLKESLVSESEALRYEREKFEREWEVLDEKRVSYEAEKQQINDERSRFEKLRHLEEERLKNKELELNTNIQRELEDLRLKQEAFESTMEHERAEAHEALRRERADISREHELRKHELEMNIQKKQEDIEKKLRDKESEFNRRSELQLNHIKSESSLNESNIRKLKVEQERLEREKTQLSSYGKKLEADQLEIQKDINTLRMLNKNLRDQREEFIKEREGFLALVEQCKVCKNCGVQISELPPLGLQPITDIQDAGNVLLPSLADGFVEERVEFKNTGASPSSAGFQPVNSGGRMSWLQKCSTIFKFSPGKKPELSTDVQAEENTSFVERLARAEADAEANYQPSPSYQNAKDARRTQLGSGTVQNNEPERLDKAGDEPEPSIGITDISVEITRMHSVSGIDGKVDDHKISSVGEGNEVEGTSPENDSQTPPLEQRRRQPSRRGRPKAIKRTRTMKAVVEDAKAILGKASESEENWHRNGDAVDSVNVPEESLGDTVHTNLLVSSVRKKRPLADNEGTSDLDAEDSEAHSESVSLGGRRKRRNVTTPGVLTPGEKRYNFRRSTLASSVVAAQATSDQTEGIKAGGHHQPPENEILKSDGYADGEVISKHKLTAGASSDISGSRKETTNILRSTNVENVLEVQDISSQKIVQFETRIECDTNIGESQENMDEVDSAAEDVPGTPLRGSGSVDEDDDGTEDDEDEQYNASIGKKILRFFTS